jgi:hypothetical protein
MIGLSPGSVDQYLAPPGDRPYAARSTSVMTQSQPVVPVAGMAQRAGRHYHLIDHRVGNPAGFKDEPFSSRLAAVRTARERAE